MANYPWAPKSTGRSIRLALGSRPAYAPGSHPYIWVTFFDCLHDMGDPVGASRHVLSSLSGAAPWGSLTAQTVRYNGHQAKAHLFAFFTRPEQGVFPLWRFPPHKCVRA